MLRRGEVEKRWMKHCREGKAYEAKELFHPKDKNKSFQPSDHCYNKTNISDIKKNFPFHGHELLFLYDLDQKKYIYKGPKASVSGDVIWTNIIRDKYIIGEWKNGEYKSIKRYDDLKPFIINNKKYKEKAKVLTDEKNNQRNKPSKNVISEQPQKITNRIRKIINQINKNQRNNNNLPIFDDLFSIWSNIEEICNSKNDFMNFALNLYIIIYEKTRGKKSHFNGKGNPYIYRLPSEFTKAGTETRKFFDIVGAIRHEYAHSEPVYNIPISKLSYSYSDALEMLSGNRNEPSTSKEFRKLQVEILKRFESAMKTLLDIVKKEA